MGSFASNDVIGIAQTGSGKTIAYLFPAFSNIIKEKIEAKDPYMVVLSPTRELAIQIENEANKFGEKAGIFTVCIYGGQPKAEQAEALKRGCQLIVATPGRFLDFYKAREQVFS